MVSDRDPHPQPLTEKQAAILQRIVTYYRVVEEGCPAYWLARRFPMSAIGIRKHLAALHRKGWLITENSPAVPRAWLCR